MNIGIALSASQTEVCKGVAKAIIDGEIETAVVGEAGTGKTTCVLEIINRLYAANPYNPQFVCAPTNKATKVLRDKLGGGMPVNTIHRLVKAIPIDTTRQARDDVASKIHELTGKAGYDASKAGNLVKKHEKLRKEGLVTNKNAILNGIMLFAAMHPKAILHIDEGSMVSGIWRDCFREVGIQCIYYGDPHQLPPVDGDEWFASAENQFHLTENFRQRGGSQIIEAALMVRNSRDDDIQGIVDRLVSGKYSGVNSEIRVLPYSNVEGFYADIGNNSDQVIAYRSTPSLDKHGRPTTKIQVTYLNQRIREAKGITAPMPVKGEPLVLTHSFKPNDIDEWYVGDTFVTHSNAKGMGISDIPVTYDPNELCKRIPDGHYVYWKAPSSVIQESGAFLLDLKHEDGRVVRNVAIDPIILAMEPLRMQRALYERRGDGDPFSRCLKASFGYTTNGHQSQGSEYDRVTVFIEPSFLSWSDKEAKKKGKSPQSRRWIYTCLTRAKSALTIVIPPNWS